MIKVLSTRFLIVLSVLSIISCKMDSEKKEHFLFSSLEKGIFDVGYKSIWKIDTSRQYEFIQDSLVVVPNQNRPILFNIWYPIISAEGKSMQYKEYFNILSENNEFKTFSKTLQDFNLNIISNELLDQEYEELDSLGIQALNFLFEKQTLAHKNASFPTENKFPLVIYHGGAQSSFEDNSVLCEFLASHGYVVIGSAYQEASGRTLSVDAGEGSFKDIDFLVKEANKLDFINTSDLTLIGHSLGAQTLLKYQSKGLSKAKAIVPIDATFEYHSIYNDLYWSNVINLVKSNTNQFNNRLLAISEYSSFYQLYETLDTADKYYLSVGHLTHNEFIAQGIIKKWINNEFDLPINDINKSYASVSKRYASVCKTILDFISENDIDEIRAADSSYMIFEKHLKGEKEQWKFNQSIPPTPREHFSLYQEKGTDEALNILKQYEQYADSNPLYYTQYGFSWVFDLLSQNKIIEAKKVETYFNRFDKNGIANEFQKKISFGKKYKADIIVNYFENKLKLLKN
nr:hypothetical protein [uncultured Psychroserpens sp.]